jgi:hypothetical protein
MAAALVLILILGRGWLRNPARRLTLGVDAQQSARQSAHRTPGKRSTVFTPRIASRSSSTHASAAAATSLDGTNQIPKWEAVLDELLRGDDDPAEKASKLLGLLPRFPEDGQVETVQHIANLLPDENFVALGHLLTNSATLAAVQDVVLADLLNRPNAIKLPLLLEVARQPDLEKAAEAKDLLGLYLDVNLGEDWIAWQRKLEQWLKDNPD